MTGGNLSDKHKKLFHYTAFGNLTPILESQSLYAKDYRHLNDTIEVVHIRGQLHEALVPVVKDLVQEHRQELKSAIRKLGGMGALARHEADNSLESHFEVSYGLKSGKPLFFPYITSFCSHLGDSPFVRANGLLSMWRGYGDDGGVALVFDTKKLEACMEREHEEYWYCHLSLGDVIYDGDESGFNLEFGAFVDRLKKVTIARLVDREEHKTFVDKDFLGWFLSATTRFKHIAFQEEREVRLCSVPWADPQFAMPDEDTDVASKKRKTPLERNGAPYLNLFDGDGSPRLPITEIIIGPHAQQEQRLKDVKALLKSHPGITARCSETPYIER